MNIERNLLERINAFVLDKHLTISDAAYFFEMETEINETFLEVRELLAQPEPTSEPEAWIIHNKVTGVKTQVAYKPADCCWDIIEIIPLFTAPPKREPFRPEERQRLSKAYSTRAEQVAFEEGIIFAEISYGIGGGE